MPIEQLDVVPSRYRPTTFTADMENFLAWMARNVPNYNALEQSLQLTATTGTSTTSLAVGTGSKTLTTQAGKAWAVGSFVYVVSAASVANLMMGQVTAYNSATGVLTVNVVSSSGSGTLASWVIGLSAPLGSSASFSGTVTAAVLQVDANFALQLVGSNPTMTVASGARYLEFDRAADTFNFVLGGTTRFAVTPSDGPTRSSDASTANGLIRKSQLDAAQGNLAGFSLYAANQTLPLSDAGKLITVYGNAGPVTLTLPTPVGNSGKTYRVYNQSAYTVSMVTPSGSFIGVGAVPLQPGSVATFIADGTNWVMFSGGGASLKAANGWKRNDDGTMEQWGVLALAATGQTPNFLFSFPTTFPNACAVVTGNAATTIAGQALTVTGALPIVAFSDFGTNGARIRMDSNVAGNFSGTVYVAYRAIGW